MTAVTSLEVEGRWLRLSNLDKVLWPLAGFTKGDVIDFYTRVAPTLLPHVQERPLTLRRFPDGVDASNWFQTQCPPGRPDWLSTAPLADRRGGVYEMCLVNDLASLLWVANLAAIELHPLLARRERPDEPTVVVFDLDPGPPADVLACCEVALGLRDMLDGLGLATFPKTSGSVGLHVYVPLNTPHGFPETKGFAREIAALLTAERPDRVTDVMRRAARGGKVLVDWLQNDPTRSTLAPYSLRGTGWPTVSTPVTWEEVERALATASAELLTFEAADVLDRLERVGDLFAPVLELTQRLPA